MVFAALALLCTGSAVQGMGIIPTGGSPTVGLSARELSGAVSRPLPPLNSTLLDEVYQTLFPIGDGIPPAQWEQVRPDRLRLTISANIVLAGNPSRILTSYHIATCWNARARERWDALWALRGIEGIDILSGDISGLVPVDDRTLDLYLRPDVDPEKVRRALRTSALRLAVPSTAQIPDGTGPFLLDRPSPDRSLLTPSLSHIWGRAYLDQVSVVAYPSADESVLDFGRGSLDALIIASNERDKFTESSRAATGRVETIGQALIVLIFNPAKLPDTNERIALGLAVDRQSLAQVVLGEGAVVSADFSGTSAQGTDWSSSLDQARRLYSALPQPRESLTLLVPDDPAAEAVAGRLRANWESFGVPVQIAREKGPLALSMDADAILLALRLPSGGEGVLPQCLALYDRSGWWDLVALGLSPTSATAFRSVRSLDPTADLEAVGSELASAGLAIPLVRYDILFAPGPDISLVPNEVFPGTIFWRAFMGRLPEEPGD